MDVTTNSLTVLERRYLKKDEEGKVIETPEEMFRRVASTIASADGFYGKSEDEMKVVEERFYQMMTGLKFLPNSPTLMNAGRELGQLSACFVLPILDSMESIFEAIKNTALIHRSGGGTGFSFSRLRPKNSMVKTTGGIASGPVSFMKVFDAATHAVKQGGTRRGANMGILRVDHPDILEFISCKEGDKDITNFNISVALTDAFMEHLEKDEEYELIDPHTKKPVRKLSAKKVFDLIVDKAWRNGEPGIIFIDRINEVNPTPKAGAIESTNPCGEQPLLPYESCNLGSINLSRFVIDKGAGEPAGPAMDWGALKGVVVDAVHFLDNVIDMNKFPLPEIEKNTKANRKIGLGVMGWAECLIALNIPYDSDEAVALASNIMKFISEEAHEASRELAKCRGAFPNFEGSTYDTNGQEPLRNATLTTIAPTGTISIIAGCSSGIEPLFSISYYRQVMDNDKLIEVNPIFEELAKKRGFYSKELMDKIAKAGSIAEIVEIPEDVRKVFTTAHDIVPDCHIKMQAIFQRYTDNAVSKTVNFSHEASVDDVRKVYMLAYRLGCKGVTVYRDRSREEQVLNIAHDGGKPKQAAAASSVITPRPRPRVTRGTTTKIGTGCGSLYVTINEDDEGKPFEIFTQMGKSGGCAASQLESLARLVSLALRSGLEVHSIMDQLRGIRCPSPAWEKGGRIFSCADAIARVIEQRIGSSASNSDELKHHAPHTMLEEAVQAEPETADRVADIVGVCPDCGAALRHEEGCIICKACGYSKC